MTGIKTSKAFVIAILMWIFIAGSLNPLIAQTRAVIYLKGKNIETFRPGTFFTRKAIERRIRQNIDWDVLDIPVNKEYLQVLHKYCDSFVATSRWLNAVWVYVTNNQALEQIQNLPFVKNVEIIDNQSYQKGKWAMYPVEEIEPEQLKLLKKQTERLGLKELEQKGWDGSGIRIAVFDGGFPGVDEHPAFEHIRKENRIIATYDFIKKKEYVYYGNSHGRMTLACIGGIYKGVKMGLATGAEFLLAKTEIGLEPYWEEVKWLEAAEWADKMGADIISSSLGYGFHRYFQNNMDGKSSLVCRAASIAARKGILIVNSAGNEGSSRWKTIITPADHDSVLAVGGINPATDIAIRFSSYGPSSDKRLKPNVSAYAHVITAGKKGLTVADGTSFSCPLVSGFAACIWQAHPEWTNMDLFHEIEHSGHLYPYFDYVHGYGVPQAHHFTDTSLHEPVPTFHLIKRGTKIIAIIHESANNPNGWIQDDHLLFYHIQNQDRWLKKFGVIRVDAPEIEILDTAESSNITFQPGDLIRVWFRGFTLTQLMSE